jgi:hypothetical protein
VLSNYAAAAGWHTLQSAGHGVVGGGLSELTGGNFKDGFIGAAAGAMLSPVSGYANKQLGLGTAGGGTGWQLLGRTATSAAVGGTVTAISGGKFGNGAATAAFMHLVNAEATGAINLAKVKKADWGREILRHYNGTYGKGELLSAEYDLSKMLGQGNGLVLAFNMGGGHSGVAGYYNDSNGTLRSFIFDPAGSYTGYGNRMNHNFGANFVDQNGDYSQDWSLASYANDLGDFTVTGGLVDKSSVVAMEDQASYLSQAYPGECAIACASVISKANGYSNFGGKNYTPNSLTDALVGSTLSLRFRFYR